MLAVLLVLVCAFFRIIPHPPNFAPVGATAVLAGRTMRPVAAIAVTLAAMTLSNAALGLIHEYQPFGLGTLFVYGGFAAQVLIARALRGVRGGALAAALLGATAFFVLSNFGVWVLGGMYPHSLAGLAACYLAALPFFGATLVGDVLWTVALVLVWRALASRLARHRTWVPADTLEVARL
jgi:hypothetical protein